MNMMLLGVLRSCVGALICLNGLLAGDSPAVAPQAVTHGTSTPDTTMASPEAVRSDYVIGGYDVLSVVFWDEPQLSGDVLVRPDGKISVPLLDEIQAAGLTPRQLRARLVEEARRFVASPVVTVAVRAINSRKVYVIGQVGRPGQFDLEPSMTLLQLLAAAGGLEEFAKSRDIRVMRTEEGQSVTLRFDYAELTSGNPSSTFELRAGDIIIVP